MKLPFKLPFLSSSSQINEPVLFHNPANNELFYRENFGLLNFRSQFPLSDSLERLGKADASNNGGIAFVGLLPPNQTGVANFTVEVIRGATCPVDLYFWHKNDEEYLEVSRRLNFDESKINLYSVSAYEEGLARRNYSKIIWVLGNSNEFKSIMFLARSKRDWPCEHNIWFQIHDPVSLNLLRRVCELEQTDFKSVLYAHYGDRDLASLDWKRIYYGDYRQLIDLKICGIKALFNDLGMSGLIVHSTAAKELILSDWTDLPQDKVQILFHPIFPHPLQIKKIDVINKFSIGAFGVPGGHKQTDLIIEAFCKIKKSHTQASLVIAGYLVSHWMNGQKLPVDGILYSDSPNNNKLYNLMNGVNIAIQLRSLNTGESSGIVPQLLSLNKRIICTDIGSFKDYNSVVRLVKSDIDAEELASVILEEILAPDVMSGEREAFISNHSREVFFKQLLSL